ncbi:Ubiquitin conjugation factor E4 [Cyanidiococcus yangmingshanensis]|uniref:Ubiquitin conjugation factor E4 n=1 Tax=Cyanidiococcus yangmingshanensis TaxID=2690220 RepID=A0A7J7IFL3_9RHOD|nr:Ubiquitin conjugation factor E4 [Cyanidiococcus yangmingshanensis]
MKQELDVALQQPHSSMQRLEQQLMRSQCERALERLHRDRQSCHIYLLDSASLDRVLHFLAALASYVMQVAGFQGTLPLPAMDAASVPRAYALLPESLFELIAEIFQSVTQLRLPVPLTTVASLFPHFVEFATMLLSNTLYLRNVHIRARYAEWLAQMFPAVGLELRNALGTLHLPPEFEAAFLGNEQVVRNLPPALMQLYIDVERTGTHTQFFDKFAMRFYISEVLVAMWRVPIYEQILRQLATTREDLFVHFSNMLFNDANFLLDETLLALAEIHELERHARSGIRRRWWSGNGCAGPRGQAPTSPAAATTGAIFQPAGKQQHSAHGCDDGSGASAIPSPRTAGSLDAYVELFSGGTLWSTL